MYEFFESKDRTAKRRKRDYTSDILIVLCLMAVFSLMILPLPMALIDVLVAVNITMAIILILSAVYIRSAIEFAVFPTLLLISTLFRLALSVATTRMILINGDAGKIIDTFGTTVAGGNIVVGLVVFLIITVVQFIVVAKGAERVAEVSARFSLDAMPGKQLSIDSDLRSGLITKDEARKKRSDLELESKLHGSLDGAMKFVKGDAIASIIIIVINILGGLAIGVLQNGMEIGPAMAKYSILTIGDGMVAQIPALLNAMAAGFIVTRTSRQNEGHLGASIKLQLAAQPRVFLVASVICLAMALVPGFPTTVFLGLALLNGIIGIILTPILRGFMQPYVAPFQQAVSRTSTVDAKLPEMVMDAREIEYKPVIPLLLEVDRHRFAHASLPDLRQMLERSVQQVQMKVGIPIPGIDIHATNLSQGQDWILHIYESPIAGGHIEEGDISRELVKRFYFNLLENANQFLGIQGTNDLINTATIHFPDVVNDVIRTFSIPQLTLIFQALIEEKIPLRDMRSILETLAKFGQNSGSPYEQLEAVRIGLSRQISSLYAPTGHLNVNRLDPELETYLAKNVSSQPNSLPGLSISPDQAKDLLMAAANKCQENNTPVILTMVDIRRALWQLLDSRKTNISVLSFNELNPSLRISDVGMISVTAGQVSEIRQNTPALQEGA